MNERLWFLGRITHSVVCVFVCLSVLGTQVSCAKTAESIEVLFGGSLMWVQDTMY